MERVGCCLNLKVRIWPRNVILSKSLESEGLEEVDMGIGNKITLLSAAPADNNVVKPLSFVNRSALAVCPPMDATTGDGNSSAEASQTSDAMRAICMGGVVYSALGLSTTASAVDFGVFAAILGGSITTLVAQYGCFSDRNAEALASMCVSIHCGVFAFAARAGWTDSGTLVGFMGTLGAVRVSPQLFGVSSLFISVFWLYNAHFSAANFAHAGNSIVPSLRVLLLTYPAVMYLQLRVRSSNSPGVGATTGESSGGTEGEPALFRAERMVRMVSGDQSVLVSELDEQISKGGVHRLMHLRNSPAAAERAAAADSLRQYITAMDAVLEPTDGRHRGTHSTSGCVDDRRVRLQTARNALFMVDHWMQRVDAMRNGTPPAERGSSPPPPPPGAAAGSRDNFKTACRQAPPPAQVFLGGSCNPTTWRRDVAIPRLKKAGITFYNPQVDDWSPELVAVEAAAKADATVLFFVIDKQTRAIASMNEVVEEILRGRTVVLVIEDVEAGADIAREAAGVSDGGDGLLKDLNRGRMYLRDIAARYGALAFVETSAAVE